MAVSPTAVLDQKEFRVRDVRLLHPLSERPAGTEEMMQPHLIYLHAISLARLLRPLLVVTIKCSGVTRQPEEALPCGVEGDEAAA